MDMFPVPNNDCPLIVFQSGLLDELAVIGQLARLGQGSSSCRTGEPHIGCRIGRLRRGVYPAWLIEHVAQSTESATPPPDPPDPSLPFGNT